MGRILFFHEPEGKFFPKSGIRLKGLGVDAFDERIDTWA